MKTDIVYWVCTMLLSLAYLAMGVSNYVQPGDMNVEIAKSGYPPHFFMVLGVLQVLAAIAISVPKAPRVKEWAYAGIVINLIAAGHHHYVAGDGIGKIAIPFAVLLFAIASYSLRPMSRRLTGSMI
jgi:uncharacterized membrane protein YphA (DoxX/SURF4 family)